MKAVVYKGNGEIALADRPVPKILDDRDAIIKVTLTTICSSDIHIKHGAVPRAVPGTILGHEFVGRVVETGSAVKKIKPGDRVSVNVETFCGECFFCKRGFVNNCTDPDGGWALGCRIDGGQAEYVRIPFADNGLTVIPDHVSDEQALFNGDILSTGYWAAKIGEINPADTVVSQRELVGLGIEIQERAAVVAAQSVERSHPKEPFAVLEDATDGVVGNAVVGGHVTGAHFHRRPQIQGQTKQKGTEE